MYAAKTYVAPSPLGGKGVFALIDMSCETKFNGHNDDIFQSIIPQMNDGDFTYPKDWSYDTIMQSFILYDVRDICNTYIDNDKNIVIIKPVKKDEELTRRYGVRKWILWIVLDILGINPLSDNPLQYPKNYTDITKDLITASTNFNNVVNDTGYKEYLEYILKPVGESGFTNKLDLFHKIMDAAKEYSCDKD